jgi:hypothetical protein
MSPELFARSFIQAFATRLVTSDTWFSATARPEGRSESRSGRARLTESEATRRHDRFVLASSMQPMGPCNRLRITTSSSLTSATRNERDADRLALLDRIADRVPELDLEQQLLEWTTLDDGHEALLVNGGGIDGGNGVYLANYGDDVHAVGSLAPIVDGYIGCIVIRADGSRYVARAVPDPLAG